jgi:hypothetical protein
MVGRVFEITFLLIILYLVLANAQAFSTVLGAASGAYSKSVSTLQGRGAA